MSSGMTTAAFGLSPKQQLSLTVVQCLTQVINLLCIGQTAISIIQAADLLDPAPYREPLILAYLIHTVVIGAGVQAFLVDRCWKIFKKRVLPIIPLIALGLVGLSAGVLLVSTLVAFVYMEHDEPQEQRLYSKPACPGLIWHTKRTHKMSSCDRL
ncbi:transmembrane protein, putative [Rhizoctonia solani AG-3 Rhs1AP]|uniref:Transmembrane protein, putative n=1 Tax=Rhizoctonia solani AG-3 Rhs1AP TaxID=1086054 RepID=X8J079_9AGAM|nr:transmembrane protein, putative [Rhizoctonia solani AG-3 Rhs1AP]